MFFCSSAADGRCGAGQVGIMARRAFYPLYQLGNPPTRIFRTDYFLTLVRPGVPLPEDTVQFRIPMDMTRVELKDYLEKIYNVPVAAVRTRIQFGSNKQRDDKNRRIKKPDYKVAYVQLGIEKRLSPGETGCKFQPVWSEGSAFKFFEGEKTLEKILGINLDDKLLKEASRSKESKSYRLKTIEAEGQTFQFPDLFPDKDKAPEPDSSEEIENKIEKEKQKKINDLKRGDVPNWFWH